MGVSTAVVARQPDICTAVEASGGTWDHRGWAWILGALPPVSTGLRYSNYRFQMSRPSLDGRTFYATVRLAHSGHGQDGRWYFYRVVQGQVVKRSTLRDGYAPQWINGAGAMASFTSWVTYDSEPALLGAARCRPIGYPYGRPA